MSQTKKQSLIESGINILIGYSVSLVTQIVVFPLVGVQSTINQNIKIGIYFTIVSLLRSYIIRRYFNNR